MTWIQLRLDSPREQVETLENRLLGSGAVAVTLEDNADEPVLEPGVGETPLWHEVRLTGLYRADTNMQNVLANFTPDMLENCHHRIEILEDKDWEREWMTHYQPMQFGRRLWICPSWLEPPEPDAINLLLDPGLAFGTGTHPTTDLCLRELDSMDLNDATVVDYGCGSGILALAALKLGAQLTLGVDNDPQALTASLDNTGRNGLAAEKLQVSLPSAIDHPSWDGCAHLVVANILAGPLIELAPQLLRFMRPGATLLLSGLLQKQAADICAHYAATIPLEIAGEKEGWVCLRGQLPD